MDAAGIQFVLFGLAAAAFSNLSRSPAWRSSILLLASLTYLGLLANGTFVLVPLGGFLLLGYGGLTMIRRGSSKSMVLSVLVVLVSYIWLKKYTFLPQGIFLHFPYLTLGLSYIFFRVLHLLIETGDASERRHIGIGAYLMYTLNFTTLLSGPIQRYEEFAEDQFAAEPIPLTSRVVGLQIERIVRGYFKVNVLAMFLNAMQQDALAQLRPPFSLEMRLFSEFELAVVFPFFLYANFSGYIDIVIGLARLMRLRLPENFDRPFSATSFLDFWNRWHITLSTWFKNYVYNPLLVTLMRRISSVTLQPYIGVFCFFVTFFLVGIWHGRTSEFVVYGLLQGGGISINKLWQIRLTAGLGRKGYATLARNPLYIAFARGLTFSWFAFSLLWLWAIWKQIDAVFAAISFLQWIGVWFVVWLSATVSLALWEQVRAVLLSISTAGGPVLTSRYARVVYASALGLVGFVVTVLLNQPAPGIVYKTF